MRIISLKAENLKRLRAVEITPDGNLVVIGGRNAQGKSSVLDAIWMALAGAAGAKETSRPIRDGEKHATVQLDLGDLVVTREWTPAGTTLKVAAQDGARYSSPQTVLDGLIGRLSFDPLEFANQDPKQQLATLLSVVELPFDPDELARKRLAAYDERTEVNRDAKRLVAQLEGMATFPADTPDDEVSSAAILEDLAGAVEANRLHDDGMRDYQAAQARVVAAREHLAAAEAELSELGQKTCPEKVDLAPIRERLAQAETVNANVRAKVERVRVESERDETMLRSAALTRTLDEIDVAKSKAIADAKMPLDGLSFDEDGVLYQGVPFSQSSAAERLRVGIAMAMALNPKIRVIRITDGSLLDSENLALIEEMAAAHDFQVWVERVDESGTVGVTIEDGQVAVRETAEAAA